MKQFIKSVLKKLGWRLTRESADVPAFGLDSFFAVLQSLGFAPRYIVDVGANHGNWTRTALRFFPKAHFTLVEPQDQLKIDIQDLIKEGYQLTWINAGASDQPGNLLFTVAPRDDGSSFLPSLNVTAANHQSQMIVPVRTINEIVASNGNPAPDIIKIDAEGFDLKALAGASDFFGKTDIFLVEAVVCVPSYENSVTEVIRRMDTIGYQLMDITDLNRSPRSRVLWFCEMAFVRHGSPLLDAIGSYL